MLESAVLGQVVQPGVGRRALVARVFLALAVGVQVALQGVGLEEARLALAALVDHVVAVHLRVHHQLVRVEEDPQADVAGEHLRLPGVVGVVRRLLLPFRALPGGGKVFGLGLDPHLDLPALLRVVFVVGVLVVVSSSVIAADAVVDQVVLFGSGVGC